MYINSMTNLFSLTLNMLLQGKHPFHNYTIPSEYRNQYPEEQSPGNGIDEGFEEHTPLSVDDSDRGSFDESASNGNSLDDPLVVAKWLHQPDENDRITDIHFRKIFQCSCGNIKNLFGTSYVEISICGESFMLHQVSLSKPCSITLTLLHFFFSYHIIICIFIWNFVRSGK